MTRQVHGAALAALLEPRQDLEYGGTSADLPPRRRRKFVLFVDVVHRQEKWYRRHASFGQHYVAC
jgi:hypothetical protein